MTKNEITDAINEVLTYHCAGNWDIVKEYFGTELASQFDLMEDFDYLGAYQRGDLKECGAFSHIAVIQKCLVDTLFDINTNTEAQLTYCNLQYHIYKLSDIATGVNKHIWLH